MDIEAPTFNALNIAQRRALILRDQLRWTDPHHLDSFIDGLAHPEPPRYQMTNGITKPDLILVSLKESQSRFDLGNVLFPEDEKGVLRAFIVLKDGKAEMYTEEPLPRSEKSLNYIAIHKFIASTMVPIFKEKMRLVLARISKYNEARRMAYNSPAFIPVPNASGETLKPVIPHNTNKRVFTSMSSIPASLKITSFDTVPEQVKVGLFNSIAQTAFPNLDNLISASWNVVSVYSASGSSFLEMHKAVVGLQDVLQDFDVVFGAKRSRMPIQLRSDWVGESQSGASGARVLTSASPATRTSGDLSATNVYVTAKRSGQQAKSTKTAPGQGHLRDISKQGLGKGLSKSSVQGFNYSSESSSGEDEIPAQCPPVNQELECRESPTKAAQSLSGHTLPVSRVTSFARPSIAANPSSRGSPAALLNRFSQQPQASVAAPPPKPLPTQSLSTLTFNASTANPEISCGHEESVSSLPKTRTSARKAAQFAVPRPSNHTALPAQSSTPVPTPIHSTKRKASTSPGPLHAKRNQLAVYTTAQLRKKQHTTKSSILRQWGSLSPSMAPHQYLGLLAGLEAEIERREAGGIVDASEGEAKASEGNTGCGEKDGRSVEKKGMSAQRRWEDIGPGPPRPIAKSMSGVDLGDSLLGVKKSVGIPPASPMLGAGLGGKKGGRNGGEQGKQARRKGLEDRGL